MDGFQAFAHEAVGFAVYVDGSVQWLLYSAPVCHAAIVEVIVFTPEAEVRIDCYEWHGGQSQCVLVYGIEELGALCVAGQREQAEHE